MKFTKESTFLIFLSIVPFVCLFFPLLRINIYEVNDYNLQREILSFIDFNFFDAISNPYFNFGICPYLYLFIIILNFALILCYLKTKKKIINYIVLFVGLFTIILFSYSNSLYTKFLNIKAANYIDSKFIEQFPNFPLFDNNAKFYWFDQNIGSYISITIYSIQFIFFLFKSFFFKNDMKNE